MINNSFFDLLKSEEYSFLRENKHLGENIICLALGGSYAYGTNTENSDIDIRGIALNSKKEILLLKDFETYVSQTTDTTIYSLKKTFELLIASNPNVLEILGCEPEHYLYKTEIFQKILDNKNIFLSQKAIASFNGYANNQLNRLLAALAKDSYTQTEREKHIMNSCYRAMNSFNDKYQELPKNSLKLFIDKSDKNNLDTEIFIKTHLDKYPARDFKNIFNELNSIIKNYDKLTGRNNKKDNYHINKQASHVVRLYLMSIDLLEKGELITYRKNDIPLLLDIRNGKFMDSNGKYKKEFFDLVKELEEKSQKIIKTTCLPLKPNYDAIENLFYEINENIVTKK